MKILIFAAFYHPYKGGYVESISELSKNLFRKNYDITIVTCNTHNLLLEEVIEEIKFYRVPCWNLAWLNNSYPIPHIFAILKLLKNLSKNKFDFILTNTRFFPITWLGFFYGKIFGIRIIHIERGGQHTQTNNCLITLIGKLIDHTMGYMVVRFSDVVVGVSEAVCSFLVHLGAKNPIKIYNGIVVNKDQNVLYEQNSSYLVTFVGRLVYTKGLTELIKAIAFLPEMVTLQIVGDGPYKKNLEELVKKLNLENRVIFRGELNHNEVISVLLKSTIFINPSYSEGLPRCVLEAASVGLPVIATNVGGTKEIICDENHGILISPKNVGNIVDSVNSLTLDVDLRKKMGTQIKERVIKCFNWDQIICDYEKECFNTHNVL